MRNLRFRSAATAATTALVAALALTACGQSDAVGAASKPDTTTASTASTASTSTPKDEATEKPQDSTGENAQTASNNNSSSSNKANSKGSGGNKKSNARTTCTGGNTKVTVTNVTRPINHLLVTATNTGSKNCDAYYAPLLGFDDAQSVTQINEDSQPQAVVTLSPGQSAYASIALGGGDGSPTTAAYKLSVSFSGRDNQGSVGSVANLTLPKGTKTNNDTSVSYWQATMADALTW
ncbi:DUF4232 domain-containing protein [Streptomyces niveus]|uniref:DUF4232 domain-containing protein n=1 Tax=Streptomyces niveus TaxID=193462 RepID=UPI002E339356|nr:DUF4232 domain-containing protein [Streptomyces niveus]